MERRGAGGPERHGGTGGDGEGRAGRERRGAQGKGWGGTGDGGGRGQRAQGRAGERRTGGDRRGQTATAEQRDAQGSGPARTPPLPTEPGRAAPSLRGPPPQRGRGANGALTPREAAAMSPASVSVRLALGPDAIPTFSRSRAAPSGPHSPARLRSARRRRTAVASRPPGLPLPRSARGGGDFGVGRPIAASERGARAVPRALSGRAAAEGRERQPMSGGRGRAASERLGEAGCARRCAAMERADPAHDARRTPRSAAGTPRAVRRP